MGNGLLDPLQVGVHRFNSTLTALLMLTDDIRVSIYEKITLLLMFDFSKAFDTISPVKLIRKMKNLGFSKISLRWIASYLLGQRQRAVSKSGESKYLGTNLGVPQGSVLGPLLFCLYINDLQHHLNIQGVRYILYVDDLQIYVQIPADKILEGIARL